VNFLVALIYKMNFLWVFLCTFAYENAGFQNFKRVNIILFVCSLDAGGADGAAEAVAQPPATREHRIAIPQSPRPPTASSPFCTSQSHRPHHQPFACRRKYAIERGTLSLLNCCGRGPAQRLATGSTVRASNPSRGEIFRNRSDGSWGPQWVPGFFPGGKTAGV